MAAVTSNHHGNGDIAEKDHATETSPSRFTAVNGRESATSSSHPNGKAPERSQIEEGGPRDEPSDLQRPEERLSVGSQRDDWAKTSTNGDGGQTYVPGGRHPQPPNNYSSDSTSTSPHKRKRSDSEERQTSSATSYHSHSMPKSPEQRRLEHESGTIPGIEETEAPLQRQSHYRHDSPTHDDNRGIRSKYPPLEIESREQSQSAKGWYSQEPQSTSQTYSTQRTDPADLHLAETLQEESRMYEQQSQRGGGTDSPEDDDERGTPQRYAEYGTGNTPLSGVEAERKRRKRVFSNRTKTGCMTCRRRKKKCDEQHPECKFTRMYLLENLNQLIWPTGNNCLRGGFVCQGYNTRNTWQKPSSSKGPVPLQSKDGYPDAPAHPYQGNLQPRDSSEINPDIYAKIQQPHLQRHNSSEGRKIRPIMIEEDRDQSQRVPSPTRSKSRVPWSKGTWPNPGNPSYLSDHLPKTDYRGVPPLHELSREHHSSSTHSSESTLHRPYLPPNVASPQTHSAQAAAQLALQHTTSLRPAPHRMERTEKEKMLAGELYRPFNPILLEERERCKAAVWRFNNSTNPNLGVSREERARLFREILQPSPYSSHHSGGSGAGTPGSISSISPVGSVGERVVVEAPFTCDYGYNIIIGDDVLISANCTITDTCSVRIGSRCVIGPNVNFQGGTLPIDPAKRKGSQGPAMGNAITIEDDCWIGCRAIIMPGVTIGRCSTVAAGSVVTKVGLGDKRMSRNTLLLTLISEYRRFHRLGRQPSRTDTRR